MLGFQFKNQKSSFNYRHIVLELSGLEYFSLGYLAPTRLLEEPEAKEGAEDSVWRTAVGTLSPATEHLWTPFCHNPQPSTVFSQPPTVLEKYK